MDYLDHVSPKVCLTPYEGGITSLEIESRIWEEDTDDYLIIGRGSGYIFENPFDDDILDDLLDMVSSDTYALHGVLTKTERGREVLESAVTIVYIHTLKLKEEYRGKGIGLKTMKFVVDQFACGLNLILLHPAPLGMCVGEEGRDIAIKKLEEHWSKIGFQRLGTSNVYYLF